MAIQYNQQNKLFQVDYQSPFGGIDSTAYASAIDPHNFVDTFAGFAEDNILKSISQFELGSASGLNGTYMGFIPVQNYTTTSAIIGYIITSASVYPASYLAGTGIVLGARSDYVPAKDGDNSYFHYLVIDDIQLGEPSLYWTANGWNEIWTYDTAAPAVSLLTNYCGGGILGLLDNQLLNLGGFSLADGPVPNRISWSAPGEYGQFQPYDVPSGTGNYAAGFNDLPSTSDIITGFAAIGTVGYLFRSQGITQINPTGNGIQPFQFNHLWASELGIGSVFPFSISQYGTLVCFISDSGIYSLSLAGLSEIAKTARTYIYDKLNFLAQVSLSGLLQYNPQARVVPYLLNSPEIYYVLAVKQFGTSNWLYLAIGVATGNTYQLAPELAVTEQNDNLELAFFPRYWLNNGPTDNYRNIGILSIYSSYLEQNQCVFKTLAVSNTQQALFSFRKEQMKFGFVPTVTKIALLAALIDPTVNGTISISIDGGTNFGTRTGPSGETLGFPDITIVAGVANPGLGIIDNVYSDGVVSLQRPQLVLKLTNVQAAEIWYQGTLANFDLI